MNDKKNNIYTSTPHATTYVKTDSTYTAFTKTHTDTLIHTQTHTHVHKTSTVCRQEDSQRRRKREKKETVKNTLVLYLAP